MSAKPVSKSSLDKKHSRRRKITGVTIVLFLAVAVLAGGTVGFAAYRDYSVQSQAEDVAAAMLEGGDFSGLHDVGGLEILGDDPNSFIERYAKLDEIKGQANIRIDGTRNGGDVVTVDGAYEITGEEAATYLFSIDFERRNLSFVPVGFFSDYAVEKEEQIPLEALSEEERMMVEEATAAAGAE